MPSPPETPKPLRTEIALRGHAGGAARDALLDAPEAKESGKTGIFRAAHQADLPYCQIERLAGLGALPPTGFQVACFPLRIVGASAAPARVVAMVPES